MLTPEQIKNLQPGDPLIMHGTFEEVSCFGNIVIKHKEQMISDISTKSRVYVHPSCVSLPSEIVNRQSSIVNRQSSIVNKYDPTRLFKKGDKVKRRTVDGRTDPDVSEGIKLTVTTDENKYGNVRVREPNGRSIVTKSVFLELVTPVEAIEPYYIESETFDYEIRNENDDPDIGTSLALHIKFQDPDERQILSVKSYYESYVYSREHAIADAEAEVKRLNEEWRKEQNNG